MSKPHRCPVCDGTGIVSRPPDVPGDVLSWPSTDTGPYSCRACSGSGIVWEFDPVSVMSPLTIEEVPCPDCDALTSGRCNKHSHTTLTTTYGTTRLK